MKSANSLQRIVLGLSIFLGVALALNLTRPWPASGQSGNNVTVVSAAGFDNNVAPGSIAVAFGANLSSATAASGDSDPATPGVQLPTLLAGTQVRVNNLPAGLFFVSPFQVNFLIPAETPIGVATVEVFVNNTKVAMGTIEIKAIAPSLFLASQEEPKVPAGNLVRVRVNGSQSYEQIAQRDPTSGKIISNEVDLGPEGERVFLVLYFTGLRFSTQQNVRLLVGSNQVIPSYAGPQPDLAGVDQLNAQIPRSLIPQSAPGSAPLGIAVVVNGVIYNQNARIRIAPARTITSGQVQMTSFTPLPALAGSALDISGAGFAANPSDNQVFFIDATKAAVEGQMVSVNNNQMRVLVPFGAGSGQAVISTPRGEGRSAENAITLRTSISGFVQDNLRRGVSNLTVRMKNANLPPVQTNPDGAYVLPDVPEGLAIIEFDGTTTGLPFPKQSSKLTVTASRDNQFSYAELKPADGATVTANLAATAAAFSVPVEFAAPQSPDQLLAGNVTLELPPGAVVSCPGGGANCPLTLTAFERGRTPADLPPGHFSSTIIQLTPFGATISPGAKLIFPNSDNLPAGSKARLFKFDQTINSPTLGTFIDAGEANVSVDGLRIETAPNAITESSYYFVSALRPTATLTGHVSEADGRPVRRAVVQTRGQSTFTDNFGGFVLTNIPVLSQTDQVVIEASFMRPDKRVDRAQRTGVAVTPNGMIIVSPELVLPARTDNRTPLLIAPASLTVTAGEARDFDFIATDPDSGQSVTVTAGGASFASVISKGSEVYSLRLAPAANATGSFTVNLAATDPQGAAVTQGIAVTVNASNNTTPKAQSQSVTTLEDAAKALTLTGSSPNNQPLTFIVVTAPKRGGLSGGAPNLSYTPAQDYNGLDSFTFRVRAGNAESSEATVFIAVKPVNDAPALNVNSATALNGGETLSLDLTATDVDVGQVMKFAGANLPAGAAVIAESETSARLVWTPAFAQAGTYTINLTVSDNGAPALINGKAVTVNVDAKWAKTSGPEGGAIISFLNFDGALYVGTSGGGIYRSTNNGQTWTPSRNGLAGKAQTVNAMIAVGGVIFAGTFDSVYRSNDNGQSWVRSSNGFPGAEIPVFALLAKDGILFAGTGDLFGNGIGMFRSTDHGQNWTKINNGLSRLNVTSLVRIGSTIYASTGDTVDFQSSGGLYVSNNNGDSWSPSANGLAIFGIVPPITALLAANNSLFAGALGGLFRSLDNGVSWSLIGSGLPSDFEIPVLALTVSESTLYAGTYGGGIYRSINNGSSWTPVNNGLTGFALSILRLTVAENGRIFAGTGDTAGRGGGLYRSTDNAASWQLMRSGITASFAQVILQTGSGLYVGTAESGLNRSTDNGQTWTQVNNGLSGKALVISAIAEHNGALYIGTDGGGVYRSANNGQSWAEVNGGLGMALDIETLMSKDGALYAGTYGDGVFRSTDNGGSWTEISDGLDFLALYVYALQSINNVVYAATEDGVYRLAGNGQTWMQSSVGLPIDFYGARAITSAKNNLFVGMDGGGVYRSSDNGQTWSAVNTGLSGEALNILTLLALGDSIYLGTASLNVGGQSVFRSTDNGQSWQPFRSAFEQQSVYSITTDGERLFAATFGDGVFVLANNVQSWAARNTDLSNRSVNAVAVNGSTLFTGTLGGGVFRSTDQGQSWTSAGAGLPASANVQTIAANNANIYAGVFGQGVYRSINSGVSWIELNNGLPANTTDPLRNPRNVNSLKLSGNALFAATDGGVFKLGNFATNSNWAATTLARRTTALVVNGSTIYAGTFDDGVYRSTDQGLTWVRISQGLANLSVISLGIGSNGLSIFAGTEGGVYRFNPQTQSWTAANQNLPDRLPVFSFAAVGEKLYAGSVYGVFLSTDNGASWKQLNAGLLDIYVTSLVADGKILIAGTRVGGVFVSSIP